MNTPQVSILIPVFNREKLIANCIQSALHQTFTDFEVVVVDNHSSDGTWEICRKYAEQDNRVRIFRNDVNIGPVLNWQRCINEASGLFGKILFSDDLLFEDCLAKTVPFLMNDPEIGFVITAVNLGETPSAGRLVALFSDKSGKYPSSRFIEASLYGGQVTVSPGNALFRMSDLRRNLILDIPSPTIKNFLELGAGPDLLLYLLTARTYRSFAFINDPLCFFRSHEGSITASTKIEEISRYYTQASIWFVEQYLSRREINKYYVYAWYRFCQNSRPKRWVRPSTFLRGFTARSDTPLFFPIFRFALYKLKLKFGLTRSSRDEK
ncbi:MAG: glycosyltransferase family 2 protein [Phycisphaerae bacterium]|nr:glycosyltransferase family 2 protein [Phycisphaerae bacterium]